MNFQIFLLALELFRFIILDQPRINYFISLVNQKPCQYGTICLNEVLNPNLRFNSLFSQNLFEEHKLIVDNFWSLKPQSFPNQNLEYAYWKTVSALAQHLQSLQNQLIVLETQKISKPQNPRKSGKTDKRFENQYSVNQSNLYTYNIHGSFLYIMFLSRFF